MTDEQYKEIRLAARPFVSARKRFVNFYNHFFDTRVGDSDFVFTNDFRREYTKMLSAAIVFEQEVERITHKAVKKDTISFLDWIPSREEVEQLINS